MPPRMASPITPPTTPPATAPMFEEGFWGFGVLDGPELAPEVVYVFVVRGVDCGRGCGLKVTVPLDSVGFGGMGGVKDGVEVATADDASVNMYAL